MNKLTCDICQDLIPLVKDEIASEDSEMAVLEHIKSCEKCREMYGEGVVFVDEDKKIVSKLRRNLRNIMMTIAILSIFFGISLSATQFMFYNIIIMPSIGAVGYVLFKKKSIYVCMAVFVMTYLKEVYHSLGYAFAGSLIQAFLPPFWWALIYLILTALGVAIAFLLNFGFKKEGGR